VEAGQGLAPCGFESRVLHSNPSISIPKPVEACKARKFVEHKTVNLVIPDNRSWIGRLGDFVYDMAHLLLTQFGALLAVIGGAWLSSPTLDWKTFTFWSGPGRVIALGSLLALSGAVLSWRRGLRATDLQVKYQEKSALLDSVQAGFNEFVETYTNVCQDLFKQHLSTLANEALALSDAERISLYFHNGQCFVLAGRYSKNPEFCKPGRPFYPDTEGCIGHAWLNGECHEMSLPDPETDKKAYLNRTTG
jgi:hypothetical protein